MADKEAEEAHEEHQEAKKADAEAEARFLQSGKIVLYPKLSSWISEFWGTWKRKCTLHVRLNYWPGRIWTLGWSAL